MIRSIARENHLSKLFKYLNLYNLMLFNELNLKSSLAQIRSLGGILVVSGVEKI